MGQEKRQKHQNVYIAIWTNKKNVNFNIILIDRCKFENKNKVFTIFVVNCTYKELGIV